MADEHTEDVLYQSVEHQKEETQSPGAKIEFHYIKSNHFRVLHVTGAFGGITPQLDIHMNVFGDRPPIPKIITHEITLDSTLGKETGRTSISGIVREVEADIVMDLNVAKSLITWLTDKVTTIENAIKESSRTQENDSAAAN